MKFLWEHDMVKKSADKFENGCILMHCGMQVVIWCLRHWHKTKPFCKICYISSNYNCNNTKTKLWQINVIKCYQLITMSTQWISKTDH